MRRIEQDRTIGSRTDCLRVEGTLLTERERDDDDSRGDGRPDWRGQTFVHARYWRGL